MAITSVKIFDINRDAIRPHVKSGSFVNRKGERKNEEKNRVNNGRNDDGFCTDSL